MVIAKPPIVLGPESNGTRMSLEEFSQAEGQPGYLYELERGVVVVVQIPGLPHGRIIDIYRLALYEYRIAHPGVIDYIGGGAEAKQDLPAMESERHADLAVYLNAPLLAESQPWDYWTPDIVIEVVSPGSEERDYKTKREDYLRAGVKLYLITDPGPRTVTVLIRRNDMWAERVLDESAAIETPLLPGFSLAVARLFEGVR